MINFSTRRKGNILHDLQQKVLLQQGKGTFGNINYHVRTTCKKLIVSYLSNAGEPRGRQQSMLRYGNDPELL